MFDGNERIILSVIVFVYFILLILLALYINRKTKTYEDYNVAGRTVSFFPLILTFIGTGVGGSTLLGYMENGYSLGMGQQWIHITMFTCVIIFALFVLNRVRSLGETYKMVTIGDYTALRYGEEARIPTVISILFSYCAMRYQVVAPVIFGMFWKKGDEAPVLLPCGRADYRRPLADYRTSFRFASHLHPGCRCL